MSKTSKALRVFGTLLLIGVITTLIFLLLPNKNPYFWNITLLSFGVVSFIGVCFQIYYKEVVFKENWSKTPIAFRFVWWSMFITNSFNFVDQFMTASVF